MRRAGPWIAGAIVVVTNAYALFNVWWNRSGEPEALLTLTERETGLWLGDDEDSGTRLSLVIGPDRYGSYFGETEDAWFDEAKLREIGFDCSVPPEEPRAERFYQSVLSRQTYVALEYEGQAWTFWQAARRRALAKMEDEVDVGKIAQDTLESAQRQFERDLRARSRLFVVDAGNDPVQLREKHADRHRFAVVPAEVNLHHDHEVIPGTKQRAWRLSGAVRRILVNDVHVPREHVPALRALPELGRSGMKMTDGRYDDEPRFETAIAFGQRYEPWILDVHPTRAAGIRPLPGERPERY